MTLGRKWAARSLEWPRKAPLAHACLPTHAQIKAWLHRTFRLARSSFFSSFTFQLSSSAQGFTSYLGNLPRKPVHQSELRRPPGQFLWKLTSPPNCNMLLKLATQMKVTDLLHNVPAPLFPTATACGHECTHAAPH